jgi:hypothetical protein
MKAMKIMIMMMVMLKAMMMVIVECGDSDDGFDVKE